MSYSQDLADLLKGLETYQSVPAPAGSAPFLATWSFDQGDKIPFLIVSKPMNLGSPTVRKFFRRLEVFGDGWVNVMAFADSQFLVNGHAQMSSNPTGHRFVNLPRGSKGYELNVIMTVMGRLDGVIVHYDPTGLDGKEQ